MIFNNEGYVDGKIVRGYCERNAIASNFIEKCVEIKLLHLTKNDRVFSKRLLEELIIKERKSKKARESAIKRWEKELLLHHNLKNMRCERNAKTNKQTNPTEQTNIDMLVASLDAPTPSQETREFFENESTREEFILKAVAKGFDASLARNEIKKFCNHWMERTPNGRKQLWETKKTFEVRRRLATWFGNIQKFYPLSPIR